MASGERRIGTAGWALPPDVRDRFAAGATQLERYASRFNCVEINSSFYRPHRASTYERWARTVPDDFRFALKVPKEITHVRRLVDVDDEVERFLDASAALGHKRDVLLVQLPPSFAYDDVVVPAFLHAIARALRRPRRVRTAPRDMVHRRGRRRARNVPHRTRRRRSSAVGCTVRSGRLGWLHLLAFARLAAHVLFRLRRYTARGDRRNGEFAGARRRGASSTTRRSVPQPPMR